MKNNMIYICIGIASIFGVQNSKANYNNYHFIQRIQADQNTCEQTAQDYSRRFTLLAKGQPLTSVSTKCLGEVSFKDADSIYKLYNLSVNYQTSSANLSFFKVNFLISSMDDMHSEFGKGIYSTYAECLADIPNKTAQFSEMTGLGVLSAICENRSNSFEEKTFTLIINSLGHSKAQLYQKTFNFYGPLFSDLKSAVLKMFDKMNAKASGQVNNKVALWSGESLVYYSKDFVPFRDVSIGRMTPSECKEQAQKLRETLESDMKVGSFVACVPNEFNAELVDLKGMAPYNQILISEEEYHVGPFYSYQECMNVKSDLDRDYTEPSFCYLDPMNTEKYLIKRVKSL